MLCRMVISSRSWVIAHNIASSLLFVGDVCWAVKVKNRVVVFQIFGAKHRAVINICLVIYMTITREISRCIWNSCSCACVCIVMYGVRLNSSFQGRWNISLPCY